MSLRERDYMREDYDSSSMPWFLEKYYKDTSDEPMKSRYTKRANVIKKELTKEQLRRWLPFLLGLFACTYYISTVFEWWITDFILFGKIFITQKEIAMLTQSIALIILFWDFYMRR